MMNRRTFLQASAAVPAFALAGCDSLFYQHTFHIKLTASGSVRGQASAASTVFEVKWSNSGVLAGFDNLQKWEGQRKGDALLWDVGSGGTLAALWEQVDGVSQVGFRADITQLSPLLTPAELNNGGAFKSGDIYEMMRRSTIRAPVERQSWPVMVRIPDRRQLRSIQLVDPEDVSASFGEEFRFDGFWLEATEEPISRGIADQLPLMAEYQNTEQFRQFINLPMDQTPLWGRVTAKNFMIDYRGGT